MYQSPSIRVYFYSGQDLFKTSNEWSDENVDEGGWT